MKKNVVRHTKFRQKAIKHVIALFLNNSYRYSFPLLYIQIYTQDFLKLRNPLVVSSTSIFYLIRSVGFLKASRPSTVYNGLETSSVANVKVMISRANCGCMPNGSFLTGTHFKNIMTKRNDIGLRKAVMKWTTTSKFNQNINLKLFCQTKQLCYFKRLLLLLSSPVLSIFSWFIERIQPTGKLFFYFYSDIVYTKNVHA